MSLQDGYIYFKTKLHGLTDEQKKRVKELSDVRRFVYNWGYNYVQDLYNIGQPYPKFIGLCTAFTELKKQEKYRWLKDYQVTLCRYALKDLDAAYQNFFDKTCRHPKLKGKDRDTIRFATRPDRLSFKGSEGRYAYIPGLSKNRKDLIDCNNHRIPHHKGVKYEDTRIKFDGLNYWLCVAVRVKTPFVEVESMYRTPGTSEPIGIDVGIRTSATLSDGTVYERPNKHYQDVLENRRNKLQAAISRDQRHRMKESARTGVPYEDIPKSKNELKREEKFNKTCDRIANIYQTHYHQIAADIVKRHPDFVVLEDIDIGDLQKSNRHYSGNIYEARLGTIINYIGYKCVENGIPVIYADDDFPSSQICSFCGNRHKPGPEKIYRCPYCGYIIDRDLNAAVNLLNFGIRKVEEQERILAQQYSQFTNPPPGYYYPITPVGMPTTRF